LKGKFRKRKTSTQTCRINLIISKSIFLKVNQKYQAQKVKLAMINITDNPIHDFNMYDAEREEKLQALVKCDLCKEPIQQDMAVCFEDKYICDDCLAKLRRVI
jgi:formylmethanofuran dehydrogenase subunit E